MGGKARRKRRRPSTQVKAPVELLRLPLHKNRPNVKRREVQISGNGTRGGRGGFPKEAREIPRKGPAQSPVPAIVRQLGLPRDCALEGRLDARPCLCLRCPSRRRPIAGMWTLWEECEKEGVAGQHGQGQGIRPPVHDRRVSHAPTRQGRPLTGTWGRRVPFCWAFSHCSTRRRVDYALRPPQDREASTGHPQTNCVGGPQETPLGQMQ